MRTCLVILVTGLLFILVVTASAEAQRCPDGTTLVNEVSDVHQMRIEMCQTEADLTEGLLRLIRKSDGGIESEHLYQADKLHGLSRYYDADGVLEQEARYENGELHGISRLYLKGKLTAEGRHQHGKLVSFEYSLYGVQQIAKKVNREARIAGKHWTLTIEERETWQYDVIIDDPVLPLEQLDENDLIREFQAQLCDKFDTPGMGVKNIEVRYLTADSELLLQVLFEKNKCVTEG